jgi:hypothetical protein
MRAPQTRRLGGLRAHLAAAAESAAEEDTTEQLVRAELLDDEQMAGFVRRGFHSFQLTDFTDGFHESVAADAEAASSAHPGDQQKIWAALAPKIDRVVKAPRFQGALRSILGPDMMMVPQGHLHLATPAGQSFHKDGTGHGVRSKHTEEVIVMYYSTETELEMGPTVILPGSHLFSVDRSGFYNSEDRIDVSAVPPPAAEERQRTGAAAIASLEELSAWQRQASEGSQAQQAFTAAHAAAEQDEEHFAQSAALLGEGYRQLPIACPPGTICVVDADLVHRAGRAALGARWRPMLKLSARRVSPPTGTASWNHDQSVVRIQAIRFWGDF